MAQKSSTTGGHPTLLPPKSKVNAHAQNSTLYNLYLLGRIPFAIEGTLWCLLGSTLHSSASASTLGITAVISSASIVFLANVSVNYANEYFDYEADSILACREDAQASHGGSTLLVDGTFRRYVALLCATVVQLFIALVILTSRWVQGPDTHLQGSALWLIVALMAAAHQYVGPPLRLHYRGAGEVLTSLIVSTGTMLYGYLAQETAGRKQGLGIIEVSESIDSTLVLFFVWAFLFELSRVLMMHVADMTADLIAKKHTLVSILGYNKTSRLYICTTILHVFLAWMIMVLQPKAAYLMVPMMLYSIPIAFEVQAALGDLRWHSRIGRKAFTHIPILVSLQTLATPVLFIAITLLFGNCLR
ncbi:hypothetical protein GQ53DRAFT_827965 [Thozetella sp. PMI_491]|nr:hypothetical protein GQ53DRAFT_827965 [Thozetella sp. PMI_491]